MRQFNGMPSLSSARLYGILDLGYVSPEGAEDMAKQMLAGGVDLLQLRAKKTPPAEICKLARTLSPLCRAANVPLILNDHPHLLAETRADGVHVGQDDLPVPEVRELVGPEAIVGLSTHSLAQVAASREAGPDYIGFGPLFATATKPDYKPIGIGEIADAHRLVDIPIFCIGGIKLNNLPEVLDAGARRVVIVSGILTAPRPAAYCRECRAAMEPLA